MHRLTALAALSVFTLAAQTRVKLAPGVTAILDRAESKEQFSLTAKAGQTLLIEVDANNPDVALDGHQMSVYGPESTGPLTSSLGEHTHFDWMGDLEKTGTYRVAIDHPSHQRYQLRFTLLDPHDPRLDVGIRPEQISILDPGKAIYWDTEEFSPPSAELAAFGPARLQSQGGRLVFTVVSVEGFKKAWWMDDDGPRRMTVLESALKQRAANVDPKKLPGMVSGVGDVTFVARKQFLAGPHIRAVRYLCDYNHADAPPVSPLGYAAEGITTDGRFYVDVRAAIDYPAIGNQLLNVVSSKLWDVRAQIARRLETAKPSSFDPDLASFDAMVQSFTIR
jgi:hypothetical protein